VSVYDYQSIGVKLPRIPILTVQVFQPRNLRSPRLDCPTILDTGSDCTLLPLPILMNAKGNPIQGRTMAHMASGSSPSSRSLAVKWSDRPIPNPSQRTIVHFTLPWANPRSHSAKLPSNSYLPYHPALPYQQYRIWHRFFQAHHPRV
jgi:hypothetical protein